MQTWRSSLLCCLFLGLLLMSLAACGQSAAKPTNLPRAQKKEHPLPTPSVLPTQQAEDYPVRLLIPAIHVDAPIEQVGVLQSGDLDTPRLQQWTGVGWYSASPDPGATGSSVIDGHLDRPGGYPAVFWNLHLLQAGDQISVIHRSGKSTVFVVTSTASYSLQDVPLQAIFGTGGGRYLNLITCAGDWIPSQHQTTLRMVVYSSQAM